jgi:hypothetical protein
MASQQEKAFCVLRFEVFRSVITVQREFCAWFKTAGSACPTRSSKQSTTHTLHCITDLDTSKRSTQKAFSCCDAILETDPAAP